MLVTGHRGSGKSSELARLAEAMAPDFFVVWLDVEKNTDIFSVNHIEVLFLLGVAVRRLR